MKLLLFDQNLSPRLVTRLADVYPDSIHVQSLDLGSSLDRVVWDYAREHDYMIVTKDADFSEISLLSLFCFTDQCKIWVGDFLIDLLSKNQPITQPDLRPL